MAGMGSGTPSCEVSPREVSGPLCLVHVTDLGAGTLCSPSKPPCQPPSAHCGEVSVLVEPKATYSLPSGMCLGFSLSLHSGSC